MLFRQLFDSESSTYTYLLADLETHKAVLIDPVREQHERDWAILAELGLKLVHTLETHVHADHITGSGLMRERAGSTSVMSVHAGAGCADRLVTTGETIEFGGCSLEARLTPGHTDGCVSYVDHAGGRVFSGDTLLIRGCGRTDFQQGDSRALYASVNEQLFALPDETALYPGHDYKGRTSSTIGEEKEHNPRLGKRRSVDEFVEIMANLQLAPPKKIDVAVPANLSCGGAPEAWARVEPNGAGVPEVDVAWVKENKAAIRIIDVREPVEFDGPLGHIEGADLIPLAGLADIAKSWPRSQPTVLVCRSGGRSGQAAKLLEQMRFHHIASMRGGMSSWTDSSPGTCG